MTPPKHSLLIVDDNELNRDLLSRRLALKGYAVAMAASGHDALALLARQPFDLVLLDVEMPGLSGLEVLCRIRETRSQTDLPVIMVTARTEGTDVVEALRLGANDYVTKPVDFAVALARVRTHVALKSTVTDLRVSEQRYALAFAGARDGLWDWNLETNEVYWSDRWKQLLGHAEAEVGSNPDEWFSRIHENDVHAVRDRLRAYLAGRSGHYESEHRMRHRNGAFRWVLCRGAAVWNADGAPTRLSGSMTDITDAKVHEAVTGLPNRHFFLDVLDRAISRAHRRKKRYTFALLVLGLDRFAGVKESLGPLVAERLLLAVSQRLQARLRPTDALASDSPGCTLARLGGDEFNVLIDDIGDASDAVRVGRRLRAAFEQPFDVDGRAVLASASVGIAVSTTGYERAEEILRDAEVALRRARANQVSRCEIFDPAMRAQATSRLRIEAELRNAIDHDGFAVHYQPIVETASGTLAGFEALMRWRTPLPGMGGPAQFIAVAESVGMMPHIGRLALVEACGRMAAWQRQFGHAAPRVMSVNVSGRQFAVADFASEIEAVLDMTGLAPPHLKLEITEGAFIDDIDSACKTIEQLRVLGVGCSLDDFGTGYSSLSYLRQLKVETLKVDRSLVSRVDDGGAGMLHAIVGLGHSLGMDIVAEGVETADELARVSAAGCEYAQGFHLSAAVTAAAAEAMIEGRPRAEREPLPTLAS